MSGKKLILSIGTLLLMTVCMIGPVSASAETVTVPNVSSQPVEFEQISDLGIAPRLVEPTQNYIYVNGYKMKKITKAQAKCAIGLGIAAGSIYFSGGTYWGLASGLLGCW